MNKIINIVFILIVLVSCTNGIKKKEINNNVIKDTLSLKKTESKIKKRADKPQIAYYYELDDKYSSTLDSVKIEGWWNNKIETIKELGIKEEDIANGKGGPNGAEWNTYTNLYFVGLFPTDSNLNYNLENKNYNLIKITVNDKPIKYKIIKKQKYTKGILISFMLEKEIWTKTLRAIESTDYIPLYGKEKVEMSKKEENVFAAPMDTGEIFKLTIEVQLKNKEKIRATKYFHIAFGE